MIVVSPGISSHIPLHMHSALELVKPSRCRQEPRTPVVKMHGSVDNGSPGTPPMSWKALESWSERGESGSTLVTSQVAAPCEQCAAVHGRHVDEMGQKVSHNGCLSLPIQCGNRLERSMAYKSSHSSALPSVIDLAARRAAHILRGHCWLCQAGMFWENASS